VLRPIESNLSIYNVEQKSSQIKDPNAHQFQAMQNEELVKNAARQTQTVQTIEKAEGEVKVRERREDPEDRHGRQKKRGGRGSLGEDETEEKQADENVSESGGGLDFLA